jgi:hypothetical protein
MKRFFFLLSLIGSTVYAEDITGGDTFADGQSVTAARLNNLVGAATINPAFVSNKSSVTPASGDSVLLYQTGTASLARSTITNLTAGLFTSPTFSGTTTISQATVISGIISPTQIASNQNDYNPTGLSTATTLRLSSDASRNITGISASGVVGGQILLIHNVGSFNIVLQHQNASSSAANRFAFEGAADDTVQPNGLRILAYDLTTARWRSHNPVQSSVTANPSYTTLTDGATVTITCNANYPSQNSTVTLGGNRTLAISGATSGMQGILIVKQDGTGSRTLTLPAGSKVGGGGAGAVTLTTTASAYDILSWSYDGTFYYFLINKTFT